jgi:hypothetical protein
MAVRRGSSTPNPETASGGRHCRLKIASPVKMVFLEPELRRQSPVPGWEPTPADAVIC